jgi:Mg2+/Co2+ transporter CorC
LPLQVRSEAGNLLAQHEDEMLRGVLDVSKEELTEFMVQEFG